MGSMCRSVMGACAVEGTARSGARTISRATPASGRRPARRMRAVPASVLATATREPEGTASPDSEPPARSCAPRVGRLQKVKGGRRQADAPFRTCQVQKTGYFFFAAFFFVAFFFAAFFLAAIRGSPPPDLLLGLCSPNYREGDAGARRALRLAY